MKRIIALSAFLVSAITVPVSADIIDVNYSGYFNQNIVCVDFTCTYTTLAPTAFSGTYVLDTSKGTVSLQPPDKVLQGGTGHYGVIGSLPITSATLNTLAIPSFDSATFSLGNNVAAEVIGPSKLDLQYHTANDELFANGGSGAAGAREIGLLLDVQDPNLPFDFNVNFSYNGGSFSYVDQLFPCDQQGCSTATIYNGVITSISARDL